MGQACHSRCLPSSAPGKSITGPQSLCISITGANLWWVQNLREPRRGKGRLSLVPGLVGTLPPPAASSGGIQTPCAPGYLPNFCYDLLQFAGYTEVYPFRLSHLRAFTGNSTTLSEQPGLLQFTVLFGQVCHSLSSVSANGNLSRYPCNYTCSTFLVKQRGVCSQEPPRPELKCSPKGTDVKEPFGTGLSSQAGKAHQRPGHMCRRIVTANPKKLSLQRPGGDCDPSQADHWQSRDRED